MSVLSHTLFPTVLCGQTSKRGNYNSWKQFLLLGRVTTILLPEIEDNRNLYPEIYDAFYLFQYLSLSLPRFCINELLTYTEDNKKLYDAPLPFSELCILWTNPIPFPSPGEFLNQTFGPFGSLAVSCRQHP